MAEIRLQPSEPFNFCNRDDWQRWKRRFQQFREAGLDESAQTKQISTLLYCLGEEAEAVLTSTNATAEERKDYKKVLDKFDSFFIQGEENVIYERARFNKRNQQSGETAEWYIMVLYDLVGNCDYGEELICDRLVVGICNNALSEKLQLDATLTLETAKKSIR